VDGEDGVRPVVRRTLEREAAVGLERRPDPLRPFGDLVRGDRETHRRLGDDVVGQVRRAVDDVDVAAPPRGEA